MLVGDLRARRDPHARVTLPAWTSRPAQRGYKTSMTPLLSRRWHGVRGGEI
jgi:hypothetical protein